jgi:23S rRNA pseudouridine2604 synthase
MTAHVELDEAAAAAQQQLLSVILHKPVGYLSQSSEPLPHQSFAQDLLQWANQAHGSTSSANHGRGGPPPARLPKMACAGRLDEASSGLLIFTQNGAVARCIVSPDGGLEKEYLVRVRQSASPMAPDESDQVAQALAEMRELDAGESLRACEVGWSEPGAVLCMVLRQGRKRQIRRMLAKIGLPTLDLHRTRIGNLRLDALPVTGGTRRGRDFGYGGPRDGGDAHEASRAGADTSIALPPGQWAFFEPHDLWAPAAAVPRRYGSPR